MAKANDTTDILQTFRKLLLSSLVHSKRPEELINSPLETNNLFLQEVYSTTSLKLHSFYFQHAHSLVKAIGAAVLCASNRVLVLWNLGESCRLHTNGVTKPGYCRYVITPPLPQLRSGK